MPSIAHSKSELRLQLRTARRTLPDTQRQAAAGQLALQLIQLPNWREFKHIALYLATDGEIDTSGVLEQALSADKAVYLPVIREDKSLLFARWNGDQSKLAANRYGIGEPLADSPRLNAAELDCILLPLVGWTADGCRLGMGGGYYDRTLAQADEVLKVGLGFELQRQEALPGEEWDVKLDYVATEGRLHACAGET